MPRFAPDKDAPPPGRPQEGKTFSGAVLGIKLHVVHYPDDPFDRSTDDTSGAPDIFFPPHVRACMAAAIRAIRVFKDLGFPLPLAYNGVLEIWMKNLERSVIGQTAGNKPQIEIERNLRGTVLAQTVAHEIFHRVQYSYNATTTPDDENEIGNRPALLRMLREGGARLAEEWMGHQAGSYDRDADIWFSAEGTSLLRTLRTRQRVLEGASYDSALFWKYVAEQHGTPPTEGAAKRGAREAETQRILLEAIRSPPEADLYVPTLEHLRTARARMNGPGHFDRFRYLDSERKELICSETTWGNFLVALMLNGTAGSDSRYRFEDAAAWRGVTGATRAIPASREFRFQDLTSDAETPGPARPSYDETTLEAARLAESDRPLDYRSRAAELALRQHADVSVPAYLERDFMLYPYSSLAFRVTMPRGAAARLLRVRFEPRDGLADALVQVISLDERRELRDLYRHDGRAHGAMDRTFSCRGLSEVIILVASREYRGNFRLWLSRAKDAAILHVGNWNTQWGRQLTRDPRGLRYDWQSPEFRMPIPPGDRILLLVQNFGTIAATEVEVLCHKQKIVAGELRHGWSPVPMLPRPSRFIETDPLTTINAHDECLEALRTEPQRVGGDDLLASCHVSDGTLRPYGDDNLRNFAFQWSSDEVNNDHLLRFTVSSKSDPNGPVVALSLSRSSNPPNRQSWFS